MTLVGRLSARPEACGVACDTGSPKRKRTNSRWPQYGDKLAANRPDPDNPGGLGAEESGAERTGSTQAHLLAIQHGGRWAEVGRYYDSANDPVTPYFPPETRNPRSIGGARILQPSTLPPCRGPQSARSCHGDDRRWRMSSMSED